MHRHKENGLVQKSSYSKKQISILADDWGIRQADR
jgi:hypothetical protein